MAASAYKLVVIMSNELTACQTVLAALIYSSFFNFRIQNLFCHGIIDKHGIADGAFCHIFSDRRAPYKKNDNTKQHQRVKKALTLIFSDIG